MNLPRTLFARRLASARAFTMIEVLLAMAVVAAIGSLMISQVSGTKDLADTSKLTSDVQALNNAVTMYQTFGGSLASGSDADTIMGKLKSERSQGSANTSPGLTGSFIDPRITAVWQTAAEAATNQARAVWNGSSFDVVTSGAAGIKEFILDGTLAAVTPATETRSDFLLASNRTAGSRWVWDYTEEAAMSSPAGPPDFSGVALNSDVATAFEVAENNFDGTFKVDPSGQINVNYVFREAGYNSRLALFSLEGMGPDVYDLDTAAGQQAFLQEALRRVVAGEASKAVTAANRTALDQLNISRAQVIIDASSSQVGFNQTYTFRPGDTVAAILIPNASFQSAYSSFTSGTSNSQNAPLTSLSRNGGGQAPFYANQYATLGNGTSSYAIEDISTAGNSDNDYQDLIFKAVGLTQSEGGFTNTIADPVAFFRQDPYWNVSISGRPTLRQSLITAGIIPADTPI